MNKQVTLKTYRLFLLVKLIKIKTHLVKFVNKFNYMLHKTAFVY